MKKFFDALLEKRNLAECPLPLWRLKVTDTEFDELYELLHKIASPFHYSDNPFDGYERECALYVAEWYRRKHTNGKPKFNTIYASLKGRDTNQDSFMNAAYSTTEKAHPGLKRITPLKINNEWTLYTLLFQGGLPLNLNRQDYKVLDNLLNKDFDFDKIGLQQLAQLSESGIEQFCQQVKFAVDCKERMRMPIDCSEELFEHLKDIANETKIKEREMNPFKIEFVCALDQDNSKFHLLYSFKPSSKVKETFAQKYFSKAKDHFSVTLKNDGKTIRKCEYYKRNCQQDEERKYRYAVHVDEDSKEVIGSSVELVNDLTGEIIISDSYTFDVPHIFCRKEGDPSILPVYNLADSVGRSAKNDRLILSPKSWVLDTDIQPVEYIDAATGIEYDMYFISAGDERKLSLHKDNFAKIDFSPETVLSWMKISHTSHPIELCSMNLVSSLDEITCYRENEIGFKRRVPKDRLVFLPPYSNKWLSEPVPGKLKVTYKNEEGENLVTPEEFFYVGKGFKCRTESGRESVRITLTWPHGHCRPKHENAKLINEVNNTWEVYKEDLNYPYDIKIQFTPYENPHPFYVFLPCPFSGTYLYRTNYETGEPEEIKDGDVIPLINFSSCMFSVVGNANFELEFMNKNKNNLRIWGTEIKVYPSRIVYESYDESNGTTPKRIDSDNSIPNALTKLISSEELLQKLKQLNELYNNDITEAEVYIKIDRKNIAVKQYPFRIAYDDKGIYLKDRTNKPINYGPALKYIRLRFENWSDNLAAITKGELEIPSLSKCDDIHYNVPFSEDESTSPVLIFSEMPGQILPRKYPFIKKPSEPTTEITYEEKKNKFIESWKAKLLEGDDSKEWIETICLFELAYCKHIPFTSLNIFKAVCNKHLAIMFLNKLYLNRKKYGKYDDDGENILVGALNRMEADFAFDPVFSFSWSELINSDYLEQLKQFQLIEYDDDFGRLIELLKE